MNGGETNNGERKHALLSASSASRWMNCTPAPRLEERYPERSSSYAEEGTLAHAYASQWLRHRWGLGFDDGDAETIRALAPTYNAPEMSGYVTDYVDRVGMVFTAARIRADRCGGVAETLVEERSDYGRWAPGGFGTADAVAMAGDTLDVCDLKYGQGVRVEAKRNPQLMLYGLGMLERFKDKGIRRVRLHIIQPRLENYSDWEVTASDLLKWGYEAVAPAAAMAWKGEGELRAGAWCRFCRHRDCERRGQVR